MENEIWKDINGYTGLYQISNFGRVKSLRRYVRGNGSSVRLIEERILIHSVNPKGYPFVSLNKKNEKHNFRIHRLVAESFIPNPDFKPQVNHKDGNKLNNHFTNLEWCTNGENQIHAFKNGLNYISDNHILANKNKGLKRRRLSKEDIIEIKRLRSVGKTYRFIGEKFGISIKFTEQIIKGKKYVNEFEE